VPDPGVIVLSKHGYCTLAHIEAILPRQPLTSETTVNRARAKAAVQDYFDDINGRLYVLGYDVPVPSTNSTGINRVSHLNMLGAAAEVEMNWHSSVNAENSQLASQLFEQYDEMWDLIEGGRMTMGITQRATYFPTKKQRKPGYSFLQPDALDQEEPLFDKDTLF
jgi:hypothetical protein